MPGGLVSTLTPQLMCYTTMDKLFTIERVTLFSFCYRTQTLSFVIKLFFLILWLYSVYVDIDGNKWVPIFFVNAEVWRYFPLHIINITPFTEEK